MSSQLEHESRPVEAPQQQPLAALARTVATGTLAGFAAGLIAGGIGSRIAMRISAIAAGDRFQGRITDFDAQVGDITAGGTIFLVLLGGAAGAAGGIIYLAVRPWLADAGRWKGLVFGAVLLTIFGSAIIRSNNPDFHLFGPPALNIGMFAAIFMLYGLLFVPAFEWIERVLPPPSLRRSGLGSIAAYAFGLLLVVVALQGTPLVAQGIGGVIVPYVVLVMPISSILIARTAGRFERLSDLWEARWAMAAALVVMAVPVIAGLALDTRAIVEIFEVG